MSEQNLQKIGKDIASLYGGQLESIIQREDKYIFVINDCGEIFETAPMTERELLIL